MNGHLRTCIIDGLNVGENRFNWENRLIIFHNKETDDNLANTHILLPTPYYNRKMGEELTDQENESQGEAFEILAMFLTCYHLANDLPMPKIINHTWSAMDLSQIESIEQVQSSGFILRFKSQFETVATPEQTVQWLNDATPLFEKIMGLPNKDRSRLGVALKVYQKSKRSDEIFTQFLDLVTVLESLFTENDGEIAYKFALRTSYFIESDGIKRFDLFQKLRKIYRDRSHLIHGNELSLNPNSIYHEHVMFLSPIVFRIIPKYIELLTSRNNKKTIIEMLDRDALL